MDSETKAVLCERMADNLLVLRTIVRLSQADLAERIGVSRQTIVALENKKRPVPWGIFLSLFLLFSNNRNARQLLDMYHIHTKELDKYLGEEEDEEEEDEREEVE